MSVRCRQQLQTPAWLRAQLLVDWWRLRRYTSGISCVRIQDTPQVSMPLVGEEAETRLDIELHRAREDIMQAGPGCLEPSGL